MPLWESGNKLALSLDHGDHVVGVNTAGCLTEQVVAEVRRETVPCVEVRHSGGVLRCSESHLLVVEGGDLVQAGLLEPAVHKLLGPDLDPITIEAVEELGELAVVGIECEPDHVYFAGGVLHHNKPYPATNQISMP